MINTTGSADGSMPGGSCNAEPVTQVLIDSFSKNHHLTPRERQILGMICRGMKNTQIGRELSVSNGTIRLHIGNLHRKLNTSSKVDLVLQLWSWSCAPQPVSEVGSPELRASRRSASHPKARPAARWMEKKRSAPAGSERREAVSTSRSGPALTHQVQPVHLVARATADGLPLTL